VVKSISRIIAVSAVVALVGVSAGCGNDGVNSSDFVDRVNEVCRSLDNDLSELATPASVSEVSDFASGASKAYENALADLKKLEVPDDQAVVASARGLLANFDDQVTTLDDIAAAGAAGDQATVDAKIETFNTLGADNNDLAGALDAERCVLDPLFAFAVAPPVTEPPVTDPPATEPPATTAPVTQPPATTVVGTGTNKTIEDLAKDLAPAEGFRFLNSDTAVVETFIGAIDTAPSVAAQPGMVAGVDVVDGNDIVTTRIFLYLPEAPLPATAPGELEPILTDGNPTTPGSYGVFTGLNYTDGDKFYFVGTDNPASASLLLWAIATDAASLETAISAFTTALAS
jgi:hypothetical protein